MLVKSWAMLSKINDAYLQKGVWHNPESGNEIDFMICFKSPHVHGEEQWQQIFYKELFETAERLAK